MDQFEIREIEAEDKDWIAQSIAEMFGSSLVVSRGNLYDPLTLPGFIAVANGDRLGLITYHVIGINCEIVTLHSLQNGIGIGSSLIEAVRQVAVMRDCARLWVITTNDNLNALGFYQKRGFVLAAVYPDALSVSRILKPEIPMIGEYGIPLRDEIELEITL
jgi:ribosomal protein S18 acetylase RimI-like enzyme